MAGSTIMQAAADSPDLAALIRNLDDYLEGLYPADEIFAVDFTDPGLDDTFFAVAYVSDAPVGCGAIRPISEREVELKRFFVEPAYRRNGIAGQVLAFLENKAQELGYEAVRLETGDKQPEAILFYERNGYYPIDRYGEYIDCPSSLCYEKKLAR